MGKDLRDKLRRLVGKPALLCFRQMGPGEWGLVDRRHIRRTVVHVGAKFASL